VEIRGVYGGIPGEEDGGNLADHGLNAVFLNSSAITPARVELVHSQHGLIFAELNTLFQSGYLEEHPDAAPVGPDGEVSPPARGRQGICPTHPGYREERMEEFRRLLRDYELDGIWLDYHQAHSNWEGGAPVLPETCFCDRCLSRFAEQTGIKLPPGPAGEVSAFILGEHASEWVAWRNGVYTDWIREFRDILDRERPQALLGAYHCPWTDQEFDGARLKKLAIDLEAQAGYLDVLSPLLYHALQEHPGDLGWISSHVAWLGERLGVRGVPGERLRIWPIVQLADLGTEIPAGQVPDIIRAGLAPPATGVMIFSWGRISRQPDKVAELGKCCRELARTAPE